MLALCRDAIGFGAFFSVFEGGRTLARRVRDRLEKDRPTLLQHLWIGKTVQATLIIVAGGVAGASYGLISRPFDMAVGVSRYHSIILIGMTENEYMGSSHALGSELARLPSGGSAR